MRLKYKTFVLKSAAAAGPEGARDPSGMEHDLSSPVWCGRMVGITLHDRGD